ncbi:MAG: hypothetical protein J6Y28_04210 [Acholeplasmatales bacterium]|nr:hypothetical protein [Methanobrevibacter sp.]MBP5445357.1 hypothetical protein [Acholeplasmatales bacterium]
MLPVIATADPFRLLCTLIPESTFAATPSSPVVSPYCAGIAFTVTLLNTLPFVGVIF